MIGSLVASLLVACGSGSPAGNAGTMGAATPAPPLSGNASAEQVAEQMRGKVKCPAKVTTARAEGAPVADIVGVWPGMTWDEAANMVLCTNELLVVEQDKSRHFNIQTYGQTLRQGFSAKFAQPRVEKTSKQIMQEMQDDFSARSNNSVRQDMKPGQSKWYVSTMGVPGAERVIAAAREEWFEQGRNPTVASVEQALVQKYGPIGKSSRSAGNVYLTWAYDPLNRRVTETSPLYHQCTGNSDPDGGTNFSPDCGVVVVAQIFALRDNPGLSQYLQVGFIDQANGYAAITGTEQALQGLDAQRRAKEVEAAASNASAPKL
jgi:hypothetical protein